MNLCDTCRFHFATCSAVNVCYGNELGNDNIIKCDSYKRKIRRTTPIRERRTVGYVYGGTRKQRMHEYNRLKSEYGCIHAIGF